MTAAISLLRDATHLLLRHPLGTVRTIAPALCLMLLIALAAAATMPDLLLRSSFERLSGSADNVLGTALLMIGFVLSYALMAILWHRHTLREAKDRPLDLSMMYGYLWRVVLLGLIQLGFSVAIVMPLLVATVSGGAGSPQPSTLTMLIVSFAAHAVVLWLSLRLSLILPAAAVGRPLSLADSWTRTAGVSRTLWAVAVALTLISTALTGTIQLLAQRATTAAVAVELPLTIVEGLLIFSVLSALYARLIQNVRPRA
ncbi:hypothetical protein [Sulfitobacter sp. S190]|uniref:hypothetical protein n=1 Tax=Sulfitobacter sp. S190 TaxID=2867022 RepID=UPI0021A767A1|nr:hypothetical protein [Sulfitobacter sp. S190]UWR23604.1 hypothetical protein K3756_06445 [Sulfitobacter sp. S190]